MCNDIKNEKTKWSMPLRYAEDAALCFAKATDAWEKLHNGQDKLLMRAAFQKLVDSGGEYLRVSFRLLSGEIAQYYGVSERKCGGGQLFSCSAQHMERAVPFFIFAQSEGASRFDALNHLEDLREFQNISLLVDFEDVRAKSEKAVKAAEYMRAHLVSKVCDFICVLENIKPQGTLTMTGPFGSPYEFLRYG